VKFVLKKGLTMSGSPGPKATGYLDARLSYRKLAG